MPNIEKAKLEHLQKISLLEQQIFGDSAWSTETIEQEITGDHRQYWVLSDDDKNVRGYAGLLVLGRDADVQTIAVDETVRGSGYGRLLLQTLIDAAAKSQARQIFLEVRADNKVARSMYQNFGFEQIGTRPGYYQPDGVDAIVMLLKEQK